MEVNIMGALIRMTEFLKENGNLLTLMTQKIEECILEERSICVSLEGSSMTCRNRMNIETYEINANYMSLIDENFEVHIDFDNATTITYEEELEECFTITKDCMEFNLYFI
jgi:hypothetical protein